MKARILRRLPRLVFAREIAASRILIRPREGVACIRGTARAILRTLRAVARDLSPARTPRHFRCRKFLARFPTGCARFPCGLEKSAEGFPRRHKSPKRSPRKVRFESRTAPRNETRQRRASLHGIAREKTDLLKEAARFFSIRPPEQRGEPAPATRRLARAVRSRERCHTGVLASICGFA